MVFLSSVHTLKLGHKILPGRVTVGTFDGKTPKLTVATQGERILLLGLKEGSSGQNPKSGNSTKAQAEDITFLNINQPISCLCTGPILKNSERSFLFVGTLSSVFGYDVENNKDLFYRDVTDGVNVLAVSHWDDEPVLVTGGNCSVQGFDSEGNDVFWTVTGDNVGAIAHLDFDQDGSPEMLVGSDDFEIRIFKGDTIIGESCETDGVTCICPLHESTYAYALANGTIGVYDRLDRLWRIKSKNVAISICAFDFDGDGIPELVTAWSNGKLDIRNIRNGEVVYKDNFKAALAGLCTADVNQDGRLHLICCDVEGEIRIYGTAGQNGKLHHIAPNVEQEAVRELSMKKHHLMLELRNYDAGSLRKSPSVGETVQLSSEKHQNIGAIPCKTQLQAAFAINLGAEDKPPFIEITLTTNNDTMIRSALLFAEGIFQGECHVIHPTVDKLSSQITVPLKPPKNVVVDLHIKAYVGYKDSKHFHVFELTRQLPRFAMYALCKDSESKAEKGPSYVKMGVQERPSRISMWVNQNFLLAKELDFKSGFSINFMSLRNQEEMTLEVATTGEIVIRTADMDLAGDLVQSISSFLNVSDLETKADFPDEISQLEILIRAVDEYQEVNERLGAEIADQSGILKTLLIRAEDARMIGDTKGMRKWYNELHDVNRSLIVQHQIRCNTNSNVVDSIKAINQIIQKAARLRVGRPKANVITACRMAIKEQNLEALVRTIRLGSSSTT